MAIRQQRLGAFQRQPRHLQPSPGWRHSRAGARLGQFQIRYVEPGQRLAGLNGIAGIHTPFDDLARNAEAQAAFHPRPDRTGKHQSAHIGRLPYDNGFDRPDFLLLLDLLLAAGQRQ